MRNLKIFLSSLKSFKKFQRDGYSFGADPRKENDEYPKFVGSILNIDEGFYTSAFTEYAKLMATFGGLLEAETLIGKILDSIKEKMKPFQNLMSDMSSSAREAFEKYLRHCGVGIDLDDLQFTE